MNTINCPVCGTKCADNTGTMFHKPRCPGCGLVNPRKHVTTPSDIFAWIITAGIIIWIFIAVTNASHGG